MKAWTFVIGSIRFDIGLGNIKDIYRYRDISIHIVLDVGYCYIVIYHMFSLFLVLSLYYSKVISSSETALLVLILAFTHLVIVSLLLMIIYQKSLHVNIF